MTTAVRRSDPLMPSTRAVHHWTTTNLGEAVPGVMTPLNWALWGAPGERASRRAAHDIGVLTAEEARVPDDPAEWILRVFHGRLAMQLEFMALIGDRMPGTTGAEAIRSMFGDIPPGMTFSPSRARYPAIAVMLPRAFRRFPRLLDDVASDQDRWWRAAVDGAGALDLPGARRLFAEAVARFETAGHAQLIGTFSSIRPLYDGLEALVRDAGTGDLAVLSGTGGAEMAVVQDIWRASRGELDIADVVRAHGFHGPDEGEVSSTVWREDATPLRRMAERYAARPESESPLRRAATEETLAAEQARVLAALPARRRPAARLLLRLAAARLPLRGVAKRSFLQAVDAGRAAARRAGELLAADGTLEAPEDVFLLTGGELVSGLPADVRAVVAERREWRAAHLAVDFATAAWAGLPELVPAAAGERPADAAPPPVVAGTGVSAGVVEGRARVVHDPSFAEVEPDEVLVARTTDPSWSSIMFVSSALVVDLGGALSHAAVVARELGLPCVVNTGDGTTRLRTGDLLRVDGDRGTVEVLERAAGA